jgi:hypothetical protein
MWTENLTHPLASRDQRHARIPRMVHSRRTGIPSSICAGNEMRMLVPCNYRSFSGHSFSSQTASSIPDALRAAMQGHEQRRREGGSDYRGMEHQVRSTQSITRNRWRNSIHENGYFRYEPCWLSHLEARQIVYRNERLNIQRLECHRCRKRFGCGTLARNIVSRNWATSAS